MAAKKKRAGRPRPLWERGYRGHVYWLGKAKLGKVSVDPEPGVRYRWEAAGRSGGAETLAQAKGAVELAVALADKQMDLFD